jgi:UDP-N-acetylglucosamine--N-acetylmuramyl-(pentapeptide) pyrophosphoryl-undecaprenol N-acetylglucosamine transferase
MFIMKGRNYGNMASLNRRQTDKIILAHFMTRSAGEPFRIVLAAGGTGGHIYPAVAVVERLAVRHAGGCDAVFMGSTTRMETRVIPALGYGYVPMPMTGYKGLFSLDSWLLPWRILKSIRIARATLRQHRAQAVVCTGAYLSYPVGRAALAEGIPLFVLESNLNAGKANARLAPYAHAVVLAFDESRALYPASMQDKLHVLGNPVRTQIDAALTPQEGRRRLGLDPEKDTVFVFGGSLGARSLNLAIAAALPQLADAPYQVLWQTGGAWQTVGELPQNVKAVPYIDDMGAAYAAATVVVARSGATTIAELGIVGRPAILVPLATASTNEQNKNATVVQQRGAAVVIADADVGSHLPTEIANLMLDAPRRALMADAMQVLGRPHAADAVASLILRMCDKENA